MSNSNNENKARLLGEPSGTANAKLRKAILFQFLQELNKNTCFQCGKKINDISELSIEHKLPWMSADNPKESFYDLNNISFSHLKCNTLAGRRKDIPHPNFSPNNSGEKNPNSKLTKSDVDNIRVNLEKGLSETRISELFNVSVSTIKSIKYKKRWNY